MLDLAFAFGLAGALFLTDITVEGGTLDLATLLFFDADECCCQDYLEATGKLINTSNTHDTSTIFHKEKHYRKVKKVFFKY